MGRLPRLLLAALAVVLACAPASAATLAEALDQPSWSFTTSADLPWTAQAETTWDGVDAAQAGWSEEAPGFSWMETTRVFDTDGVIFFRWKVRSAQVVFLVDGVVQAETFWDVDWELRPLALSAGPHTLRWEVRPDPWAWRADGWVDELIFEPRSGSVSLAEALDQPTWAFSVGGTALWDGETARTHDGVDAAQSGALREPYGAAWFETTRTFPVAGSVGFWWKVSGDRPLQFFVDGVLAAQITWIVDWQPLTWAVADGTHRLRWQYGDGAWRAMLNADAGWVDEVSFTPSGTTLRTLSVSDPNDGDEYQSYVSAAPQDVNGRDAELTPFSLLYEDGAAVELEASALSWLGTGFGGWTGCDGVEGRICRVTLTSDRHVTVWYHPVPALLWYDRVAGSSDRDDSAGGIARGPDGSVWAAGTIDSGGARAWLGRYDADGARLGEATAAGRGADVAVAPDGSAYLTGTAAKRLFVRKFSPGGEPLWTRTRPGAGNGVAVSPDGASVYVAGAVAGDVLLQKYTADGAAVWTRTCNGSANRADAGRRVAVAPDGGVFVVGFVSRTGRGASAWVRKYSPAGAVLWTATADGPGRADDRGSGLTLAGGRVYATGSVVLAGDFAGTRGLWTAAFTEAGDRLWSTGWSFSQDLRLEGAGVAVGPTGSVDFFATQTDVEFQQYPFVFRLNADGTDTDGGQSHWFYELLEGEAAAIVGGSDGCLFTGKGFRWRAGGYDLFVAKYGTAPAPPPPGPPGASRAGHGAPPPARRVPVEDRLLHGLTDAAR